MSLAFALFGCVAALHAEKLVTVRATADRDYAAKRAGSQPPPRETYVFAKGQYSEGNRGDSSLEKMDFLKIATLLATDLKKENYYPTKIFADADLVIVVHWGVTMAKDRGIDQLMIDPDALRAAFGSVVAAEAAEAADGTGEVTSLGLARAAAAEFRTEMSAIETVSSTHDLSTASNASLLGFQASLAKEEDNPFPSSDVETLRGMVDEERYFIILVAYDGPAMRAGKKKKLWMSRMSIRSAGVNFKIAIDRMSGAAAPFYGTRQEGVALKLSQDRKGNVEIGDLKVLGEAPR